MPTSEDCEADVWGPRVGEGPSDRAGGCAGKSSSNDIMCNQRFEILLNSDYHLKKNWFLVFLVAKNVYV